MWSIMHMYQIEIVYSLENLQIIEYNAPVEVQYCGGETPVSIVYLIMETALSIIPHR